MFDDVLERVRDFDRAWPLGTRYCVGGDRDEAEGMEASCECRPRGVAVTLDDDDSGATGEPLTPFSVVNALSDLCRPFGTTVCVDVVDSEDSEDEGEIGRGVDEFDDGADAGRCACPLATACLCIDPSDALRS